LGLDDPLPAHESLKMTPPKAQSKKNSLPFLSLHHKAEEATAGLAGLLLDAEKAATSILSGDHAQHKSGMGEKFWQFREYDPSDRPQDIDWRQSAKGDRVYVRQKEWQTTQTALFWCQNDESMAYHSSKKLPAKQQVAMTLSLALAILLTRAGEQIGFLDGSMQPGRSQLAHERLGIHLFETTTEGLPDQGIVKLPANSSLILIGDFLSPLEDIEQTVKSLGGLTDNAMIIQTLDPAELSFPFDGRYIFEETANGNRHPVEHAASVREAYIARMGHHLDEIKETCRRNAWHWLLHSTDEDIRKTLFDAWLMMAPDSFHSGGRAA
jgi:uncharacterized protein (DUF58 family)